MPGRATAVPCPPPDGLFWNKVQLGNDTECWPWTGYRERGYGRLNRRGRVFYAHRIAFVHRYGEPDPTLVIDHLCRNRACVNPAHMQAVPCGENVLRGMGWAGVHSRKTHCVSGHELTPTNVYIHPSGERVCRTCKRKWNRENKARRRIRSQIPNRMKAGV